MATSHFARPSKTLVFGNSAKAIKPRRSGQPIQDDEIVYHRIECKGLAMLRTTATACFTVLGLALLAAPALAQDDYDYDGSQEKMTFAKRLNRIRRTIVGEPAEEAPQPPAKSSKSSKGHVHPKVGAARREACAGSIAETQCETIFEPARCGCQSVRPANAIGRAEAFRSVKRGCAQSRFQCN